MRILLIEDQYRFAEMIIHLLEGTHVEVAETLAAAKERLNEGRYDMVLVDLGLPDSYGIDTLRALQGYKVPKVVLTAQWDLSSESTALGAIDYIHKMMDMTELHERIMFNLSKVRKKPRLAPAVFREIKAYFEREHAGVSELTHA